MKLLGVVTGQFAVVAINEEDTGAWLPQTEICEMPSGDLLLFLDKRISAVPVSRSSNNYEGGSGKYKEIKGDDVNSGGNSRKC